MTGDQYKLHQTHKKNVIDLCRGYLAKKEDFDDGINTKFLESRLEALENDKFILAVAGEVSAGKSTFINALLGAEILPSDVRQTSSAIVEIYKSDTSVLKVEFADGQEKEWPDDPFSPNIDKAKEQLHKVCKVDDNYREIPSTLIDDCIIKNDGKIAVNDAFLRELGQQSSLDLLGKQEIVTQYISERTKDKIPVKIQFGYPLKWEFNELRIFDNPGVNAIGGIQDISFGFFTEANAILFVHSIKAIETESFQKFVNSVIPNRSKEMLFLILTHAGICGSDEEVEKAHAEARRIYKNIIPEDRILVVDSLLKLIHSQLDNGVSIDDIRKSESKKKILSSYREQADDEGRELSEVVWEASRFEKIFDAIDKFSMKAPNLQLQEILGSIISGYEQQESQYAENITLLKKKEKVPQQFQSEINRITNGLDAYKLLMSKTKEELRQEYLGCHSSWQQDFNSLKKECEDNIQESNCRESIRKNTQDGLDKISDKLNEFSEEVRQKLENKIEEKNTAFSAKYSISIPKVDLNALAQNALKKEIRHRTVYKRTWRTLWLFKEERKICIGIKEVFDPKKYKSECFDSFVKTVNQQLKPEEILNKFLDDFNIHIISSIHTRRQHISTLQQDKQTNDEIKKELSEKEEKKNDCQKARRECEELLENLK